MAEKRIQKEAEYMRMHPESHYTAGFSGLNMFHWYISVVAPLDSPYAGAHVPVDIRFPKDYPFSPPKVALRSKIFHPNITPFGEICLDMLEDWTPAFTIPKVLFAIYVLLMDPNPDNPLVPLIGRMYKKDRAKYEKRARSWTQKYLM